MSDYGDPLSEQRARELSGYVCEDIVSKELAPILRRLRALEYAFTHSRHSASPSDRERDLAWCLAYEEAYEAGGEPDAKMLDRVREILPKAVPPAWSAKSRAHHLSRTPSAHAKADAFAWWWPPAASAYVVRALEGVTWADLGVTQETTGG